MENSKFTHTIVSKRFTRLFASLVIVIGLVVLIGWHGKLMFLTRFSINEVPMAPSTAYVFIFITAGLCFYLRPQKLAINRNAAIASGVITICLSCLLVITNIVKHYAHWEHAFIKIPESHLNMQLGHMSLVTAILFIMSGFALLFLLSNRKIVKAFGIILTSIIFIINFILLLGYGFGAPFFYFDNFIPPAVLTVLSFLLISLALVAASDKNTFLVKSLCATSTSAKLLRTFLPTTIAIAIIESLIVVRILPLLTIHPAIGVSLVSLIVVAVVIFVISILSKSMGRSLDSALENLSESEERFTKISEYAPVLINSFDEDGRCLFWNKQCRETFGWTIDEINDHDVAMALFYPDPAVCEEVIRTITNDPDGNFREWHPVTKDGKILSMMWANFSLPNGQVFSMGHDITNRKLAEEQLRISEQRRTAYLENSPACTKILDLNFNLQFMSQAGIVGLHIDNIEEYYGKPYPFYFYPDSFKVPMIRNLKKSKESGEIITQEAPVVDVDGNELWFHSTIVPVKNDDGLLEYIMIVSIDTTEQKISEKALKQSEEQLRIITNNLPILISQIDKDLKYTFANKYYSDVGELQGSLIGKNVIDIIGKETFDRAYPQMQKALSGEDVSFENRYLNKKNNRLIIFETHYIPYVVNDHVDSFFVLGMDITERKLAEEALRESEEKLNALFTSLTEMVVMHELVLDSVGEAVDYRILDCNKVFTEFTGIPNEGAIGKLASEVYQTDPPPYLEKYAKVGLGGAPHEFTTYYEPLDRHFMISVVSPQAGKFATITTDISDMMQIQEVIIAKNKEMENYLYVASHDLRTPLVNIQGFSQRLKKQADSINTLFADKTLEPEILHQLGSLTNEDIPKTLSFILSNIEKMDGLINGLLQLSRTGRLEMNIQKIDMNELLAKTVQSLDFQIKEAKCEIQISPLPGCYGDTALLDQLFANIISNALKYPEPKRALEITVDAKKIHNRVVYTIEDTGKGIAQKYLDKIWDLFYRIDPRSGKTGEGIGLSLVKRIAEKHKGKVWVESEENKGSVFHIELHNRSFTEL